MQSEIHTSAQFVWTHTHFAIKIKSESPRDQNDRIGRQFRHFYFLSIVRICSASPFHAKSIFRFLFSSSVLFLVCFPHKTHRMQYASISEASNEKKDPLYSNLFELISPPKTVLCSKAVKCFWLMFENSCRFSVTSTTAHTIDWQILYMEFKSLLIRLWAKCFWRRSISNWHFHANNSSNARGRRWTFKANVLPCHNEHKR